MTFLKTWEEFEKTAENVYLQNSLNTRFVLKYDHVQPSLLIKLTDNTVEYMDVKALASEFSFKTKYKAELANEIKKLEKFVSQLTNHMVSKEV